MKKTEYFFGQMDQYGVVRACELYFHYKNTIRDKLECSKATSGQNMVWNSIFDNVRKIFVFSYKYP